ncbi:MAG: toxin-antitoxin system HicB family antitoxin [Rubrobacter sp.]|nr:toxin-antitoxin system HicB family antitoxin [Rubrobacter sp.]
MNDKTLEYYMGLPYTVEVTRDEDGYFAQVGELPGCMTYADEFAELEHMVEDAKRSWLTSAVRHGDPIPEPDSREYSGKMNLRMPKSLHMALARRAERENVSLNALMVMLLAHELGRSSAGASVFTVERGGTPAG